MKPLLLFLLITLSTYNLSFAQQDSVVIPDPNQFYRNSHLYLGPPFINSALTIIPRLNNAFQSQGIPFSTLDLNAIASYGMAEQRGRFKIGVDVSYGIPSTSTKNQAKKTTSLFAYGFNAGYALIFERNRQYFINVGIGRIEYNLKSYTISNNQLVAFNNLLTTPISGLSPDLSLKNTFCEIFVESINRPKRPISFNSVVRLGCRLGVNPVPWKAENNITLLNAPSSRVIQVFIQGIFVVSKNREKETKAQREARKKKNADNDWGLNPR